MSKPEWGAKHICQSCGTKFYDLQRTPILCPHCGAGFDPDALLRSRRGRAGGAAKSVAAAAPQKPPALRPVAEAEGPDDREEADLGDEELEAELEEDIGDDDVIEDTSELGEDDEVSEVVAGAAEDDEEDR